MASTRRSPDARRPTRPSRHRSSSMDSHGTGKHAERDIQLFAKAHNFGIHQSTFTAIGGNQINYQTHTTERFGLKTLLANITLNAFHDAAERGDPPRCHPETRQAIQEEILQWIKLDPHARDKLIAWLQGPAGGGKTAILQSIADACVKDGLLAASFFFGRLSSGRNTLTHIIATLAYQLAKSIPEIEDVLLTVIEKDPTIFSHSLSTQMRKLIIGPLTSVQLTSRPRLVIIDGVDECGPNDQAHKELLSVLGAAMDELKNIPIIFLIASRPEYEIRTAFKKNPLESLTNSLVLDAKYNPDKDIRAYLQSKFRTIHQERCLTEPWPAESDIDILVEKASGQFVFASTVIKFIGSPRDIPTEQLKVVLNLSLANEDTPFAELDALYRFILSSAAKNTTHVLNILTWMTLKENFFFTLGFLADLLDIKDIHTALIDMHALISVPAPMDDADELQMHHASLHDFLMDSSRSGDYHIDTDKGHIYLAQRLMIPLSKPGIWHDTYLNLPDAVYAFAHHCAKSPQGSRVAEELASFSLGELLKYARDCNNLYLRYWQCLLDSVKYQAGEATFLRLQNEFDTFFLERIPQYPLPIQECIPFIFLTPLLRSSDVNELFHILLFGTTQSEEEFEELRRLDRTLLHLMKHGKPPDREECVEEAAFNELFTSKTRAGSWYSNSNYNISLIQQIIRTICPIPTEDHTSYYHLRIHGIDNSTFTYITPSKSLDNTAEADHSMNWLQTLLKIASGKSEVAAFLRERVFQYKSNIEVPILKCTWKEIAQTCLPYLGGYFIVSDGPNGCVYRVPNLEHFLCHNHLPDTTECLICLEYEAYQCQLDEDGSFRPRSPDLESYFEHHAHDSDTSDSDTTVNEFDEASSISNSLPSPSSLPADISTSNEGIYYSANNHASHVHLPPPMMDNYYDNIAAHGHPDHDAFSSYPSSSSACSTGQISTFVEAPIQTVPNLSALVYGHHRADTHTSRNSFGVGADASNLSSSVSTHRINEFASYFPVPTQLFTEPMNFSNSLLPDYAAPFLGLDTSITVDPQSQVTIPGSGTTFPVQTQNFYGFLNDYASHDYASAPTYAHHSNFLSYPSQLTSLGYTSGQMPAVNDPLSLQTVPDSSLPSIYHDRATDVSWNYVDQGGYPAYQSSLPLTSTHDESTFYAPLPTEFPPAPREISNAALQIAMREFGFYTSSGMPPAGSSTYEADRGGYNTGIKRKRQSSSPSATPAMVQGSDSSNFSAVQKRARGRSGAGYSYDFGVNTSG